MTKQSDNQTTMKLIGLTGHIATGKTTVLNIFKKLGYPTISCDDVYHYLLKTDNTLKNKLVANFGKEILEGDEISTKKLASIATSSKKNLMLLEKITHPIILKYVFRQIKELKKSQPAIIVVDVPLLFEKKLHKKFDYVIAVACSKKTQTKRLKKRKVDKKVLKILLSRQLPLSKKIKLSDFTIHNNNLPKKQLEEEVKKIINTICTL